MNNMQHMTQQCNCISKVKWRVHFVLVNDLLCTIRVFGAGHKVNEGQKWTFHAHTYQCGWKRLEVIKNNVILAQTTADSNQNTGCIGLAYTLYYCNFPPGGVNRGHKCYFCFFSNKEWYSPHLGPGTPTHFCILKGQPTKEMFSIY